MEIRKFSAEEMMGSAKICAFAFHGSLAPDAESPNRDNADVWGCFDEEGNLAAHIIDNHYSVRFDGHTVAMGGIGGVATYPEYRNGGYIRAILERLLPEGRRGGEVFSTLYPFRHSFYRKFGYELTGYAMTYRLPVEQLRPYRHDGWVRMWKKGRDISAYTRLYNRFAETLNLAVVRDDEQMEKQLPEFPYRDRRFAYLLGDGQGDLAYVCWKTGQKDGGWEIDVTDYAYDGAKGLRALLGFLGRFAADYRWIRITMTADAPMTELAEDPYQVETQVQCGFMSRVVNVPRALELMRRPAGSRFSVKVRDDMMPENCGIWQVSDEGVRAAEGTADLEVSIRALSPMILGHMGLRAARMRPDVTINGNEATLEKVFVRKNIYISEHF